ncbi:gamma-glutamyl-gamma-aminobutyrate hydrolase family protein [Thermopolyspora sp. NPDC052614]|uniref:gamma-glutamyl-gamma-aminobutyrate hydrolase family protein n=1 Tax=Thermopolyspora sp. NPDC052614 TaxID=3155682 RepID=UPI003419A39A
MSDVPVIGITCYAEPARFTVWETRAALLPYDYVDQVARAGGQPVLLPPAGEPASVVGRLDGLILAGGGDIDPGRYGAPPHEATGYIREFRDDAEFGVVNAALANGLPLLGICRGLQVLNIALGGTLHQHLPETVGHTGHSPAPGRYGTLPVRLTPGSRLAKIFDGEHLADPNHYHHQAIDALGAGLTVTARADDGVIEAVELDDHPFCLAVQWHPETGEDNSLFAALVDAARITRP